MKPYRTAIAVAILATLSFALVALYLRDLPKTVAREREGACLALEPQVVDAPAVTFELPDETGRMRNLENFRGQVVLLNFWATWCPPCVQEMPSMERLAKRLQGKPFSFLAVSADDSWDIVKKFFKDLGTRSALTVLLDTSKETPRRYGTEKFPETYLIDRSGHIVYRFVNLRDWSSDAAVQCIESVL